MKIGVCVEWSGKRAEKLAEGVSQMSGFALEYVEYEGMFLCIAQGFERLEEALEAGRKLRRTMPPIGGGLERPLYIWLDGALGPVSVEECLAREARENRRLREENRMLRGGMSEHDLAEADEFFSGGFTRSMN